MEGSRHRDKLEDEVYVGHEMMRNTSYIHSQVHWKMEVVGWVYCLGGEVFVFGERSIPRLKSPFANPWAENSRLAGGGGGSKSSLKHQRMIPQGVIARFPSPHSGQASARVPGLRFFYSFLQVFAPAGILPAMASEGRQ